MTQVIINVGPCEGCCAECITGTFSCRSRGGWATKCGFNAYTNPGSPAKKYRTQTPSGYLDMCYFSDLNCANPAYQAKYYFSGTYVYDKTTCSETNTQNQESWISSPAAGSCSDAVFSGNWQPLQNFVPENTRGTTLNVSSKIKSWSGDSVCEVAYGSVHIITNGTVSIELTDEDTFDDAVSRNGQYNYWSPWYVIPTECDPDDCCKTCFISQDGFTFYFQEAQWKIEASGLTPGKTYRGKVDLYRHNGASYVLWQTLNVSGEADGIGDLSITGSTPMNWEYPTYAVQGSCT